MSREDLERLRSIRTFPSLVKYLRDELDWPIQQTDFDELTFDYEPEELGINEKVAAKIRNIKQLRPLVTNQPWGIFFISFEPKRLPVVALRRTLRSLVTKKRQSAKRAQQPTWHLYDLLFISSYGESEDRTITFAHFAEEPELGDQPALRVLGWDDKDTVLHLDHAHETLRQKLRWPDDDQDIKSWRESWSSAFTLGHREVVKTSRELAVRLAELATRIRNRVNGGLAIESESGPLRKLHKVFREALVHDLSADDFADMYAQTIAYGLLLARVSRESGALVADDAALMVPITSPFLRELMETFLKVGGRRRGADGGSLDFDELGINDVVETLRAAKMEAVLRDFGDKNPQEDPVIHFYELFLKEYDAKKRMQRGVFYTPRPVVAFIVRSVDELLRTEFGLKDGLADTTTWGEMVKRNQDLSLPKTLVEKKDGKGWRDVEVEIDPATPFVQILDPATGTGTFLVEVIDLIHRTLVEKWKAQGHGEKKIQALWNDYVPKHLLPRLHGYELLMAPYAIAHLKIGLKLADTDYSFGSEERVRIYLTNALEPAQDFSGTLAFAIPALAHEAEAVNAIKRDQRFTVVIGNPPYSKSSQNQGQWIAGIMEGYKDTVRTTETQIQALSDDYSKFLRLGHFTLERSDVGLLSYITNNGYLDGPLFRDMRRSMFTFFEDIAIHNLHGDSRKQFSPPDAMGDENVFDIQQGVAIAVFQRQQPSNSVGNVRYAEIWGNRQERYQALQQRSSVHCDCERLEPTAPFFLFIPVVRDLEAEFHAGWHLYDVFGTGNRQVDNHESYGAGFVTQQDNFAIGFTERDLVDNVLTFLDPHVGDEALWERFGFCSTNQWSFDRAKQELKGVDIPSRTRRCLYRPFDYRFTVFDRNICTIIRRRITFQFDKKNLGLLTTRRVTRLPYNNVIVTDHYAEYKVASHDRNTIVFPLWIEADESTISRELFKNTRRLNLNPAFLQALAQRFCLPQQSTHGLPEALTPEDIFYYIYAVPHSPTYRSRYGEFLKIDFPRLPLVGSMDIFLELVQIGGELVALHLMESPKLDDHITTLVGSGDFQIKKVSYSDETVWVDKAKTRGFRGVPEEVWNFHIGGYQVCEKWLKDRGPKKGNPGRMLTDEDIDHYQKIVVALSETLRIMQEIDEVIDQHGGWPDAFITTSE